MARIPLLDPDDPDTPAEARDFLRAAGAERGRVLNLHRAMAHHPQAGHAFMGLIRAAYRRNSNVDPVHAELAYLTATVANRCHY